ncbi:hypothetical protein F4777DRAFT_584566 [Nemania sp. FL0916]|nr:hypothetical protein F4777DRAFT_584566 [Nemania sp. FL0916]
MSTVLRAAAAPRSPGLYPSLLTGIAVSFTLCPTQTLCSAPECPFLAALDDVEDTIRWVAARSDTFDQTRVGICEFSAGATLALVVVTAIRTKLGALLEIRIVPHPINSHPNWAWELLYDCYAPDTPSRTDPKISPRSTAPGQFPPTVALFTSSEDSSRPEAYYVLANQTERARGSMRVVDHILEGVPHAFDKGAEEGSLAASRPTAATCHSLLVFIPIIEATGFHLRLNSGCFVTPQAATSDKLIYRTTFPHVPRLGRINRAYSGVLS